MLSISKSKFLLFFFFSVAVIFGSCKKEILEPSRIEPPKFYVESEMKGQTLQIYSGKKEYVTAPKIDQENLLNLSVISLYSSNFTNGRDTFQVGFMDVQFPRILPILPSEQTLAKVLENAKNNPESLFEDFPGVSMRWSTPNSFYTTPSGEVQNGSYFRISKIEDYTPPGADHAMKKVDVTFRCLMVNADDETDAFWMENGKATLLFDHEIK